MPHVFSNILLKNSPDRFKSMYLILAASCLGTILIVSSWVIQWNSATDLRDTVISNSERIADAIYYTEVDAIQVISAQGKQTISLADSARDSLDVRIRDMYDPFNIVNVQIVNQNRVVIYGSGKGLPHEFGKEMRLTDAFSKGIIYYRLHKGVTVVDLMGEKREWIDLAEIVVPLKHQGGQIIGAIAVYSDVTKLTKKYNRQMINSILAQTFMLLFLSLISYIVIIRETTELSSAYQKLESMATTDPLTGISNRRQLLEQVEQHFAMMKRSGESIPRPSGLGFVMIDVDHFKKINDTFGHLAGDSILQKIAENIRKTLRQYDVFGRYGGEEFLIVLPNTIPSEAQRIAERIITVIRESAFDWDGTAIRITLSAGVTWSDALHETLDHVLSKADQLMYEAKETGRNRVVFRL